MSRRNKDAIKLAFTLFDASRTFADKRHRRLGERKFDSIYGAWDTHNLIVSRDLIFNLITGEKNFDLFYDRFDAPGTASGHKPVAWDRLFIPDKIDSAIWNDTVSIQERVKKVKRLYAKCVKIEKDFKAKKGRGQNNEKK